MPHRRPDLGAIVTLVTAALAAVAVVLSGFALAQSQESNRLAAQANSIANQANQYAEAAVRAAPSVRYVTSVYAEYSGLPCPGPTMTSRLEWSFTVDVTNTGGVGTALSAYDDDLMTSQVPASLSGLEVTTVLSLFESADAYDAWYRQQGPWEPRFQGALAFDRLPLNLPSGTTIRLPIRAYSTWTYPQSMVDTLVDYLGVRGNNISTTVHFTFADGKTADVAIPVHHPALMWIPGGPSGCEKP